MPVGEVAVVSEGSGDPEVEARLDGALAVELEVYKEADANIVLTAMTEIRRSVPANVLPALKPNQPKARIKHPSIAIGKL